MIGSQLEYTCSIEVDMSEPRPNPPTRVRRPTRKSGGFASPTPDEMRDMKAAGALAETNHVDDIVARYTGTRVDLAAAFPEPPIAIPDHPALSGAVQAEHSSITYNQAHPADREALAAEQAYRREHELRLVHRLMLRNAHMGQIANALDKPLSYGYALRHELERRMANEASNINLLAHSAASIGFYKEMRGTALRQMDTDGLTHVDKTRYMAVAMAAENNMHKFLQTVGFYEGAPLKPQEVDQDAASDMSLLTSSLRAMMNPDVYEDQMRDVIDGDFDDVPDAKPEDLIRVI